MAVRAGLWGLRGQAGLVSMRVSPAAFSRWHRPHPRPRSPSRCCPQPLPRSLCPMLQVPVQAHVVTALSQLRHTCEFATDGVTDNPLAAVAPSRPHSVSRGR